MGSVFEGVPALQGPPDISNVLKMLSDGLVERRERQKENEKELLSKTIGASLAAGDYRAAEGAAFGAGEVGTGLKVHELSLGEKKQFAETIQRYTMLADTPEKWEALRAPLTKITGHDPGDFETGKPVLEAEFGDVDTILQSNNQAADNARADESLDLQKQRLDIERQKAEGSVGTEPPKYRLREDGTQEAIPGGAADPDVIRKQAEARTGGHQPRPLAQTAINALTGAGSSFADLDRVASTFDDSYGGYMSNALGSGANAVARYIGMGNVPGAEWWQDYQRQKNVTRHDLFGSALTRTELPQFEAADINPGMTPETIKANLARQRMIAQRAAKKLANVYIQQGYKPEVIEAAIGMPLADIGLPTDLTAAPAKLEDTAGSIDENTPPEGIDPEDWRFLTPEERQQYIDAGN